jgi:hypothetical protein
VKRGTYGRGEERFLVSALEGKRLLGNLRHGWEDNIKIGLKVIELEHVDWIYLAVDSGH